MVSLNSLIDVFSCNENIHSLINEQGGKITYWTIGDTGLNSLNYLLSRCTTTRSDPSQYSPYWLQHASYRQSLIARSPSAIAPVSAPSSGKRDSGHWLCSGSLFWYPASFSLTLCPSSFQHTLLLCWNVCTFPNYVGYRKGTEKSKGLVCSYKCELSYRIFQVAGHPSEGDF